jgi:phosphate transport system substrate-binding protein
MPSFLRAAAVLAVVFAFGTEARAQDVKLTSRDGLLEIEGTLLGYDTEFYRVQTRYGPLTVDAEGVSCAGPGCPDLGTFVAEVVVAGDPDLGADLLAPLVETYGRRRGLAIWRSVESDSRFDLVLSDPASGDETVRFRFDLRGAEAGIAAVTAGEADLAILAGTGDLAPRDAAAVRMQVLALDAIAALPEADGLAAVDPAAIAAPPDIAGETPRRLHAALVRRIGSAAATEPAPVGLALYSATEPGKSLPLVGACGRGIAPAPETLRTGDYPLVVPLVIAARQRQLPLAIRDFAAWTATPDAVQAILRLGYVDRAPAPVPVAAQGARLVEALRNAEAGAGLDALRDLAEKLAGSARLSTTIRFEPGAARPDLASDSQIIWLARDIEAGLYDGRELIFAGFSDGDGPADGNRRISERRAGVVRDLVLARARLADPKRVRLTVAGFGEAMPMACDDSDWGRRANRRVEVWVR